jgi:hypothetical protein
LSDKGISLIPEFRGAGKGSVACGATRGGGIGDRRIDGTRCGVWALLGVPHAETGR